MVNVSVINLIFTCLGRVEELEFNMPPERKILLTRDIWRVAVATVTGTRRQTLLLLLFGLLLPQLVASLYFDVDGASVVNDLRTVFTAKTGAGGSTTLAFTELIAPAIAYTSRLGAYLLGGALILLSSYFSLVHTAVDHLRGLPPRGALRAWTAGLRTALPAVLVLALGLVALVMLGQLLVAPAVLGAVLALNLPVVMVAEGRGVLKAVWHTLGLRYVRGTPYSGWAVMFNLLSLGALAYALLAAVSLASEELLFLDQNVPLLRPLWTAKVSGMNFGPVYLTISALNDVLNLTLLAALPALTSALYFQVVGRRDIVRI